jgi:hypothetical protein
MASGGRNRVAVVAHDAGGAEVLSSWARRQSDPMLFVLEGPAVKVFQRKFPHLDVASFDDLKAQRASIAKLVTGTSWSSDLERRALEWALAHKIQTQTFLDHWVNYRPRFETTKGLILPDSICVYDDEGMKRACKEFPSTKVELVENPYWEDFRSQVRIFEHAFEEEHTQTSQRSRINLLFATQPIMDAARRITGDERGYGYTEFEALEKFLEWLAPRFQDIREFRLRLHPSEKSGKYDRFIQSYESKLSMKISPHEDLALDMAWAQWVVGADTMALVLGAICERRVYSCIPQGGRRLEIPMHSITRLFE